MNRNVTEIREIVAGILLLPVERVDCHCALSQLPQWDSLTYLTLLLIIEERTGRSVRRASVHTALQRLEEKGLVSTRMGEARPERGGKPRRLVEVRPEGVRAIREATEEIRALSAGMEEAIGGTS